MRWISCSVILFSTSGATSSPRASRRIETFSAPVSPCSSITCAIRLASLEPHAEDFCRMLWILFRQFYDPGTEDGTRRPARLGRSSPRWQMAGNSFLGSWQHAGRLHTSLQFLHSAWEHRLNHRLRRTPAEHLDERAGNKQTEQQTEEDIHAVAAQFDPEHALGFPLQCRLWILLRIEVGIGHIHPVSTGLIKADGTFDNLPIFREFLGGPRDVLAFAFCPCLIL